VGIAAQTAYGDMQIVIDNTANLTTPITITFAAARLEPAVTPNTIGTIYGNILIANDGAGHKGSISNSPSVGSPTATHNPEGWDIEASPFYFAKTAGTIAAEINYFGGAGPITTFQTNQTSSGLKFQSGSDTFGNVSSLQVGGILSGRTGDILAKQTSGAGDASFLVDMAALVAPAPASTTATRNFFYVGVVHGTPTGTPANSWTGRAPMVVDDTNEFLYFYVNGAWKCCKLAPAGKVVVPTVDNTGHVITDNDDKVVWEYGT
jgi:hypothetical protein